MSDEIRTNTILNQRYQVERKLGGGGMGTVYLAQDVWARREVAIKVARLSTPEARTQFRREAGYLEKLHHHGLPRVWEVFSDTQRDFLVMEYIPGDDLETLVRRKGPQPEWLVLRWADELLDSLIYLHSQTPPIIHRDIKPNNIKLRQDETLVLVDFGIAKEYLPDNETLAGATAITPGFSPPEQYANGSTDARSDLYSAGAAMYFLLTGVQPAPAPDRASGDSRLAPPSRLVSTISSGTELIIHKALQLTRERRWMNAAEMQEMVNEAAQRLAAGKERSPKRASAAATPDLAKRKASLLPFLLGAAAVLLAVVSLFVWQRSQQSGVASVAAVKGLRTPTEASTPVATQAAPTAAVVVAPPTATATITASPTPLPTSTPIPTYTPTAEAATQPAMPNNAPVATLLVPANGMTVGGITTFRWQTNQVATNNQAFELAFWPPGLDPVVGAFSPVGTTQANSGSMTVNLDAADITLGAMFDPGDYQWGILLVETNPYRRLALISQAQSFRYERSSSDN